jgi:general secretion pathway protein A
MVAPKTAIPGITERVVANRISKHALADDPNFIASLSDLDAGVHDGEQVRAPAQHALPPIVHVPGSRRLLLELFPSESNADDSVHVVAPHSPDRAPATPSANGSEAITPAELFYGLRENPFSLSTDPKFLYHSTALDEVAQQVLTAIRQHDGMALVTGAFGTGKTTMCRGVADELDHRTLVSLVLDPVTSIEDLLKTILVDFGVASRADLARAPNAATRAGMIATLRTFLASLSSLDAIAVLIIDEAHHLPVGVLEDLPAVAQSGESSRALQVILVGDPTLTAIAKRSELRLLKEEIAVWPHLRPLAADEIGGYTSHRLGVASDRPIVSFDEGACARLYDVSAGIPRIVNQLCERALSIGAGHAATVIDAAMVDTAATELDLHPPVTAPSRLVRGGLIGPALVALMGLGIGSALWVFRAEVGTAFVQWQNMPPAPQAPRLTPPEPPPVVPPDIPR